MNGSTRIVVAAWTLLASFLCPGMPTSAGMPPPPKMPVMVKAPQRIVSTSLAGDEILIALLKEAGQLHRLKAVSALADQKEYSSVADQLGAIKHRAGRELESTLALKPDLVVLASYNRPEMISRFKAAKVPTFTLADFTSLEEIRSNILAMGIVLFLPKFGVELSNRFQTQIDQLKKAGESKTPPKILNFSADHTLNGKDTLFDDIVRTAGGSNLASTLGIVGWSKISIERLVTLDPDWIIAIAEPKEIEKNRALIKRTAGFKQLKAVKDDKIIFIPGRTLLSVSHHILPAIQEIQSKILGKK